MKITSRFSFLHRKKKIDFYEFSWWRAAYVIFFNVSPVRRAEINHKLHTQTKSIAHMPWHFVVRFIRFAISFPFKVYRFIFNWLRLTRECVICFSHIFFCPISTIRSHFSRIFSAFVSRAASVRWMCLRENRHYSCNGCPRNMPHGWVHFGQLTISRSVIMSTKCAMSMR